MRTIVILIFLSALFALGCGSQPIVSRADSDVPPPEPAAVEPAEIEPSDGVNLFVFIGEKISVEEFDARKEDGEILMDSAFKAEYRIVRKLFGKYEGETIEFKAYDHYGRPAFADHRHAMLFVSRHKDQYYHQKYQYFDVYQTTNGRWAGCGDPYRFDDVHRKGITAVPLEFAEPVTFDLKDFNREKIAALFSAPYFRIENGKAVCLAGNYVEDLFAVKKHGVLKARGVFK